MISADESNILLSVSKAVKKSCQSEKCTVELPYECIAEEKMVEAKGEKEEEEEKKKKKSEFSLLKLGSNHVSRYVEDLSTHVYKGKGHVVLRDITPGEYRFSCFKSGTRS